MIERSEIESLCDWSEPDSRGVRVAQSRPGGSFWDLWREEKDELKAAGVRVRPGEGKAWVITWTAPRPVSLLALGRKMREEEEARTAVPNIPTASSGAVESRPLVITPPQVTASLPAISERVASLEGPWSEEQRRIFSWFESGKGNLLVRARAGTGKTTTIKKAFDFAAEERMLYAVFNKKNQREAREKIGDPRVDVKNLHSVGYACIQQVWPGSQPDDSVERSRVEDICGPSIPNEVAGAIERLVGFAKNTTIDTTKQDLLDIADDRMIDAQSFEHESLGGWTVDKLAEAALAVLDLSKSRDPLKRISFNDMVWLPVACKWVRPYFDLVVVDEAQDMSLPQLTMAKMAVKTSGRVCVVGDDRQAIYGFRGAAQDGLDMMKRSLQAGELGLTTTYRCPKMVVAIAQEIVQDYKAADTAPDGLVDSICETILSAKVKIGDVILSRSNAAMMPLCLSLLRKNIPARIEGKDIGKDLLATVRSFKAKSVPDFLRKVEKWAERQRKRAEGRKNADDKIVQISDKEMTLVAIAEGLASVAEIEARISALFSDADSGVRPSVVFSSVHKAKGLEWDHVFLLSWTFRKALRGANPTRITEESNIWYVAVTRSKNHLTMIGEGSSEQETRTR